MKRPIVIFILIVIGISITTAYAQSQHQIPSWVKTNAGWWADGKIDDNSFVQGIQFLIKDKVISITNIPSEISDKPQKSVPVWIKYNAGWWAKDLITEDEFVKSVEYLITIGIINIKEDSQSVDNEIQKRLDEIEKINSENTYTPKERDWQTSGPFQIDRSKYAIGEKIFLILDQLSPDDKGQIAVLRPLNATHYTVYITIPFDGMVKPDFNFYLEPQISKTRGICSVNDITGKWVMVFRGTDYPNLYFEITKDVVPGTNIDPTC